MKSKTALLAQTSALLVGISILSAVQCYAQDETPIGVTNQNRSGDLPFSTSIGTDIERVDVSSGNLIVTIPIASIPGRGMSFNFSLRYDGRFWVTGNRIDGNGHAYQIWNVSQDGWLGSGGYAGLGWTTSRPTISYANMTVVCSPAPEYIATTITSLYIYRDSNGVKHPFAKKMFSGISQVCGADDDFLGPDLTAEGMTYGDSVKWANGTNVANIAGSGFPGNATWTDPNGNSKIEGPGGTDTLGRSVLIEQDNTNQILYKVYDSSGVQRTYTVNFIQIPVATQFNVIGPNGAIREFTGTRSVISSIVLPNGRSYVFHYESGSYGAITQIDLPTGASVSYQWGTLVDADRTHRYVTQRTVTVNGQSFAWQFSRSGTCSNMTTTVTDPLQNSSVYVSTVGGISSASFYNGAATGTPYRRYDVGYASDSDPQYNDRFDFSGLSPCDVGLAGQRPTFITTTLDNGLVSKKEFDYDSFSYTYHPYNDLYSLQNNQPPVTFTTSRGNVTEIREFDWGNQAPGPLLRRIKKVYQTELNSSFPFRDKIARELVCGPQAVCDRLNPTDEEARTDYIYDGSALISTSGTPAPQHDYTNFPATNTNRGNVTAVKRWRSASDASPLTTSYAYDDLGNIRSITDAANHTSSWSYLDRWANSYCPPPAGTNSQAYVTQLTNALSQIVQFTNYPCTGLLQARQDPNDINAGRAGTTFVYDLLGRLTQKNFADGGQVSTSYNDSPPVSVTTSTKKTSSQNVVTVSVKDGLGREIETQQTSNPLCTVLVDTSYDAPGRKASVSNPYCSTSEATYGVTTFAYDILNRPTAVNQPGGATVLTSYIGRATSVSDEGNGTQRVQRISQTDALGRLVSVCEATSSTQLGNGGTPVACGQDIAATGFLTTYQYNLRGDLTQVNQAGLSARTFNYDLASRLTSAANPETGTITYAYDLDSACSTPNSFPGLLVSKRDARNVRTCMQYDARNRVTQKNYSDGTPTANFLYDVSSVTGLASTLTNPVGRLVQASTSNTRTVSSYDPAGRVANQWQCTPQNCGTGWFPFAYVYDLMGNPTSASNGVGTTFSYVYNTAAQLTSMTSSLSDTNHPGTLLSLASYNGPGSIVSVSLGNNTAESWSYSNRVWLQSASVGSTSGSGTRSTGAVTVSGTDQSIQICEPTCRTIWDHGTKYLTVGGYTVSAGYSQSSTPASIASALASGLNAAASPVTATVSSSTITITSKIVGPAGNYAMSTDSVSFDPNDFGSGSFDLSPSGPTLTGGTGGLYNLSLTYAPDGDVLTANDSVNGNWAYGYDPFNRLLSSNKNSGAEIYSYDYDRYGNRWHQNGPYSSQLGFDANNHITAVPGVGYDLAGNLTSDGSGAGTHSYAYDAENRITKVDNGATATYVYDANGQRIRKTTASGTVDFLYDLAGHQIAEVNSSGVWTRVEIYAGGRHLATYAGGAAGVTYFNHADWLGTERVRTDKAGVTCETITSLPFGDAQGTSGACGDPSPMHFTGKERDSESGLDYFGARYNASSLGRFMTPDPLLNSGRPWNPQTWNRYAYARNNPLAIIDPTGLYDLDNPCLTDDARCNKLFREHADKLKKGLEKLQKKVNKMRDGPEKERLQAALTAFGTEGDHNGVNATFGALSDSTAAETSYNTDANGQLSATVTFDPSKNSSSTDYGINAAHEGTHIEDTLTGLVDALGNAMRPDWLRSPLPTLSPFAIEYRGYQTSAWAAQAFGRPNISFRNIQIWNSSWAAVDRQTLQDRAITNVVVDKDHPETTPHNPWPW